MSASGTIQARNAHEEDRIFPSSVIYLLVTPAVGKYTVAKVVVERNGAVVVDNQLINQPIMSLRTEWPDSQLMTRAWEEIDVIRDAVLRMIEKVVPPSASFIRTNALEDAPEDLPLLADQGDCYLSGLEILAGALDLRPWGRTPTHFSRVTNSTVQD